MVFIPLLVKASFGKRILTSKRDAPRSQSSALDDGEAIRIVEKIPSRSFAKSLAASSPAFAFQHQHQHQHRGVASALARSSRADGIHARGPRSAATKMEAAVATSDPFSSLNWLRHAELKHGRVAMAAFIGYLVQSCPLVFPSTVTNDICTTDMAAACNPPEQWNALPTLLKVQIISAVFLIEILSETGYVLEKDGIKHPARGGGIGRVPVPLNLWDPFKLHESKPRDVFDDDISVDVINGRAAMIGIMAFLYEQKVPGAVPGLRWIAPNLKPYTGEILAPFTDGDWTFLVNLLGLDVNIVWS